MWWRCCSDERAVVVVWSDAPCVVPDPDKPPVAAVDFNDHSELVARAVYFRETLAVVLVARERVVDKLCQCEPWLVVHVAEESEDPDPRPDVYSSPHMSVLAVERRFARLRQSVWGPCN